MVSRILTEAQAGAQQIRCGPRHFTFVDEPCARNLIAPYVSSESANHYDDLYDPKGYWTTVYLNTLVLGYNSKVVSRNDLPKNDDLLKPQYKQKFIIDIENHDVFVALTQEWGQEKALGYFKVCQAGTGIFARQHQSCQFRQCRRTLHDFCLCPGDRAHEADGCTRWIGFHWNRSRWSLTWR